MDSLTAFSLLFVSQQNKLIGRRILSFFYPLAFGSQLFFFFIALRTMSVGLIFCAVHNNLGT